MGGVLGELCLVAGEVGQFQPVDGQPAGFVLGRGEGPVFGPAPDGVVADAEETGCFCYAMFGMVPE